MSALAIASGVVSKVSASHLGRTAYLYVRQSTLRQVLINTESTERQYALRQRAVALGWSAERIVVIDQDQAHSAASAADRDGFQRLVAEVGMGRAGIVLGLEVSRLARNNADWHRLLEICAMTDTLICDEDGLYDPGDFNDRLLLGLSVSDFGPSEGLGATFSSLSTRYLYLLDDVANVADDRPHSPGEAVPLPGAALLSFTASRVRRCGHVFTI
jgi:hypothetical protein